MTRPAYLEGGRLAPQALTRVLRRQQRPPRGTGLLPSAARAPFHPYLYAHTTGRRLDTGVVLHLVSASGPAAPILGLVCAGILSDLEHVRLYSDPNAAPVPLCRRCVALAPDDA